MSETLTAEPTPEETCGDHKVSLTGGGQSELLEELETIEVDVINDDEPAFDPPEVGSWEVDGLAGRKLYAGRIDVRKTSIHGRNQGVSDSTLLVSHRL
jgi:hypothetical protein